MEEIKKGKVMNMMIFLKIKVLNFAHLKNEKISIVQLIIILIYNNKILKKLIN